ncbi:MAG TPA: SGNH/GDSL hydrolase family protein [Polyangiaceae bacterium]|nr:SGNH/GDSL hydrolase family protein [Polyangiaceae bacterium]
MRSRIYQRALPLVPVAAWALCLAGCSSASDAAVQSAPTAGTGGSNASAGAASIFGGSTAITSAGNGGNTGGAGAAGRGGSSNPSIAGSNTGGALDNGGASNQAGSGASTGANAGAGAGGANATAGASATAGAAGATVLPALSVYIAGDSTVSDYTLDPQDPKSQAGWGQMLAPNYDNKVKISNKAVGGRTARRFIQEGSLGAILKLIQAGDYLLVQFGTNDSNTSAKYTFDGTEYPYFADAQTDFKTYLQQYIDGALEKKAIPVLVTPPPRNSAYCNGPRSLGNYGQAMLELGKAKNVSVVDLGLETHAHLAALCPKPTTAAQEGFFKINADQTIDGTHFQENGARTMAGFVADGVDEAKLGLSAYRKH